MIPVDDLINVGASAKNLRCIFLLSTKFHWYTCRGEIVATNIADIRFEKNP